MKTIRILKSIALNVEADSLVKVTEKQLKLLENYKDFYILVEDEEQETEDEEQETEDEEQETEETKSEVKKPKIKKAEAKK